MKLLNNFYQVAGPALTHSFDATAFLLKTEKGLYLVDCGTTEGYELILDNIRSCGFNPEDIKAIFGTHGHYDHIGAAALFKRDFGCKLYLHHADKAQTETGDDVATTAQLLYGKTFLPCKVDDELVDGQIFDFGNINMEVIHTPGHTDGSVCFVLNITDMIVLIAGDTLHGGFSSAIGSDENLWKSSLEKIASRHYDAYVFGHCPTQLLSDADRRIASLKASFANYYNPWFKNFKDDYRY